MTRHQAPGGMLDAAGYRQLLDQLPDVVLVVADRDLRYVLVGGQALERAGWRAGELLGRRPRELTSSRIAALIEKHMTAALAGESTTVPVLPSTRSELAWEARFGPLRREDGAVTGVVFLLRDVTAPYRLTEGLRESEERFHSTVDVLLDGLSVLSAVRDEQGRIVDMRWEYANPVACAIVHRPLEQVLGQHLLGLFPSLEGLGHFARLAQTIETGEPCDFVVPWFDENAVAGAFEVRGARLGDGIVVSFHDATAKIQSEQRLRDSEERYRVTLASAAAGVANVGLDGRFLQVNRRLCEITGYSEAELLTRTYLDITHRDDVAIHLAQAHRLLAGDIPWYSLQKRYLRKNGSVVWVVVTVGALRDDEGRVYEYVDTVTDITAQKRAQDEVARLNAELEERVQQRTSELEAVNRNLEAFSYTVSHDLRAPLTTMSGFTEMLAEEFGDRLGAAGLEYIARIQAAGARMDGLIDELLALSHASRAEIRPAAVDLSDLARASIAALRHDEPGRQVRATVQDGVQVLGDERLLRTVMENLLGNAWKFTSKTTGAAIEFGTLPARGAMTHCYVRDNGAGFDPASAGKLFLPFSRLHSHEDFPGTGVGLASVQRIIERHHGRCWAEGQPGHGAVFHFTLPAEPAEDPAAAQ
jgi:PAS domain S-box-containing protein